MILFLLALAIDTTTFARPDSIKTPGVVLTTDTKKICVPGYSKTVRNVPLNVKNLAYSSYKQKRVARKCCEVDHLISLELGGSNDIKNLWPQPYPDAYSKDSVENWLHHMVCTNRISIDSAQKMIAKDWITLYIRMKNSK